MAAAIPAAPDDELALCDCAYHERPLLLEAFDQNPVRRIGTIARIGTSCQQLEKLPHTGMEGNQGQSRVWQADDEHLRSARPSCFEAKLLFGARCDDRPINPGPGAWLAVVRAATIFATATFQRSELALLSESARTCLLCEYDKW